MNLGKPMTEMTDSSCRRSGKSALWMTDCSPYGHNYVDHGDGGEGSGLAYPDGECHGYGNLKSDCDKCGRST